MSLKLYNTLTKEKKEFKPLTENEVKMYVCGPTVYDYLHIGNFRGVIFFNLVRNWLDQKGYKVTYVYNYTDVDDKIIKKAVAEGVESSVISERFIGEFEKDFNRLGLTAHEHNPKVTEFMPQIISFIEDLIKANKAYVVDGEVFYAIDQFENYGQLSKKNLDDLVAGQRVDVDQRKKNPFDFVLWKPSKENEPSWSSPWSNGRPGWHIECSAMIQSILGEQIDIHGGGIDLIFPHHENEIAQGEGRTGCTYCNTWMHNNFINFNDEKMSKSLGNVITAREFMNKYDPEILKYFMLSSHYRTKFNLNELKIQQTMKALGRVYSSILAAKELVSIGENKNFNYEQSLKKLEGHEFLKLLELKSEGMTESLDDDFNTPSFFSYLFEVIRAFNAMNLLGKKKNEMNCTLAFAYMAWIQKWGSVLALFQEDPATYLYNLDQKVLALQNVDLKEIHQILEDRKKAREDKNFELADQLRDQLTALGVELRDGDQLRPFSVRYE